MSDEEFDRQRRAQRVAAVRLWRQRHPEEARRRDQERYTRDAERIREQHRGYYRRTTTRQPREEYLEARRLPPEERLLHRRADTALRRARKKQATPPWADLKEIADFYAECPNGMQVDHVHALRGQNFCGLHVLHNLQYLTPLENRRKGNTLWA